MLDAGSGTLTIAAAKSLATSGQALTVTADDVDIAGTKLDVGSNTLRLMTKTRRTIGLGTDVEQMDVSLSELQKVHAGGLIVGARYHNAGIRVSGVGTTASGGVNGMVTLLAVTDDSRITFD